MDEKLIYINWKLELIMNRKKRLYYYYRILRWRILKDRSPIAASIKITQRCNLKCKHCPWQNRISKDLSFIEWKNTIDDLYRQGVTVVIIEGGEPSLHKDASKIVDYINSKNMYSIFITNGTRDISGINPNIFWISIDGMKKAHDEIRGKDVFEKVISTLKKIPDKKFISLTTLSKTNAKDIEPLCKYFWKSDLLYGLMFHFVYPYRDTNEPTLDAKKRREIAQNMIKLKKKYPKLMNSVSYLKTVGNQKRCHPWLLVVVTADGKQQHGCMVRHIEKEDCSKCDMGCGELSRLYEFKRSAAEFWSKNYGIPRLF